MKHRLKQEIDLNTGIVLEEEYRMSGRLSRDPLEGPAYVFRHPDTGAGHRELYSWRGQLHREGGPAWIVRDKQGRIVHERHYQRGIEHRDPKEGPQEIERSYVSGREVVTAEIYRVYGRAYRDPREGPWVIVRDEKTGLTTDNGFSKESAPEVPERFKRWKTPGASLNTPKP